MALIDIDALLAPVSDDQPCGDDPEQDAAFTALEIAAKGKEARTSGKAEKPAEEPKWPEVVDAAIKIFENSKHLQVAVHLLRGATRVEGLSGTADGLELINRLLESYWDDVYPLLDEEDDDDPTFRLNTLLSLNARALLVRDVSLVPIVAVKGLGEFSMRSIRLASRESDTVGDEQRPDPTHIEAAFTGADLDELKATFDCASRALELVASVDELLSSKLGAKNSLSLADLRDELSSIKGKLGEVLSRRGAIAPEDVPDSGAGSVAPAGIAAGPIRSRDDAIRSLDLVSEYFRQNEPSSPVPLLLERAKRLIAKDFIEILRDLTPGGVDEARLIGGLDDD